MRIANACLAKITHILRNILFIIRPVIVNICLFLYTFKLSLFHLIIIHNEGLILRKVLCYQGLLKDWFFQKSKTEFQKMFNSRISPARYAFLYRHLSLEKLVLYII